MGSLVEHLADLLGSASAVRDRAMQTGDSILVLRAVDSERSTLADLARLVGHDSEAVRAELAESAALADAVVELARRDPNLIGLLAAEQDAAGSTAASDLASALRDWMTRPSLTPSRSLGYEHKLRGRYPPTSTKSRAGSRLS